MLNDLAFLALQLVKVAAFCAAIYATAFFLLLL